MELEIIKQDNKKYTIQTPMGVYGELIDIKKTDIKELVKFLEGIGHTIIKPKYWKDLKKESTIKIRKNHE